MRPFQCFFSCQNASLQLIPPAKRKHARLERVCVKNIMQTQRVNGFTSFTSFTRLQSIQSSLCQYQDRTTYGSCCIGVNHQLRVQSCFNSMSSAKLEMHILIGTVGMNSSLPRTPMPAKCQADTASYLATEEPGCPTPSFRKNDERQLGDDDKMVNFDRLLTS